MKYFRTLPLVIVVVFLALASCKKDSSDHSNVQNDDSNVGIHQVTATPSTSSDVATEATDATPPSSTQPISSESKDHASQALAQQDTIPASVVKPSKEKPSSDKLFPPAGPNMKKGKTQKDPNAPKKPVDFFMPGEEGVTVYGAVLPKPDTNTWTDYFATDYWMVDMVYSKTTPQAVPELENMWIKFSKDGTMSGSLGGSATFDGTWFYDGKFKMLWIRSSETAVNGSYQVSQKAYVMIWASRVGTKYQSFQLKMVNTSSKPD